MRIFDGPMKSLRRLALTKKGQLLMPAIFVLPTLWIFVILLLETAKLSRAKIKYQLAADIASTIEMENYSDFFNRTAYVNGAFPYRIFTENYQDHTDAAGNYSCLAANSLTSCVKVYMQDIMLANGNYPTWNETSRAAIANKSPATLYNLAGPMSLDTVEGIADSSKLWPIRFLGAHGDGASGSNNVTNWNVENPAWDPHNYLFRDRASFTGSARPLQCVTPQVWESACRYPAYDVYINKDVAYAQYSFWFQVYALLGNVSNSQTAVFKTLIANHAFFRKAYHLNAGDCTESRGSPITDENSCGQSGLSGDAPNSGIGSFNFETDPKFLTSIRYWYSTQQTVMSLTNLSSITRDFQPVDSVFAATPGAQDKLFQFRVFTPAEIGRLTALGNGIDVYQNWVAEDNFFNTDVNSLAGDAQCGSGLCVHNKVSVRSSIFTQGGGGDNNTLWPDPTPKYLVVLDP
ncbi:MAG: hypothetical protein PHW69_02505 [Elusimicrobiaceae bacterium]|nr:hypothetical protein [Elusimicrobiaceae bacterium]